MLLAALALLAALPRRGPEGRLRLVAPRGLALRAASFALLLLALANLAAPALALLLAFAATRPDTFRVERSRVISAPPERVFGLIHALVQHLEPV